MITISLFGPDPDVHLHLRKQIKNYTDYRKIYIKTKSCSNLQDVIEQQFDICLISLKEYWKNKKRLKKLSTKFILVTTPNNILREAYLQPELYYLIENCEKEHMYAVLDILIQKINKKSFIIDVPFKGQSRILINDFNYMDIIKRSIGYHCTDEVIIGKILRKSFKYYVSELIQHEELILITPSLLVNIENIDTLYPDHLIFKNQEVLYFPKTSYEKLQEKWKNWGN